MSAGHIVAIVGGTGRLGQQITEVVLSEYRSSFPTVRVLTRDPSSAQAQELGNKGAELHKFDVTDLEGSLARAFDDVGVVVNVLPSASTPKEVKERVQEIAVRSGARAYFLSEFGVDHRLNDFPGHDHHEWEVKRELAAGARALAGDSMKIVAVYSGLFLEGALRPFLGYDVENNIFSCLGSPAQRITFTSTADIGRAVAQLGLLALDGKTSSQVPDNIRVAGDIVSYEEVRDLVAILQGVERGAINSEDLIQAKAKLQDEHEVAVLQYIRVLMGEGKLDFSGDNGNDLVNPGQKIWKWKSVHDQLQMQM